MVVEVVVIEVMVRINWTKTNCEVTFYIVAKQLIETEQ